MADPTLLDLGRRAVACRAWRWLPGMLTVGDLRVDGPNEEGRPCRFDTYFDTMGALARTETCGLRGYDVPDLADPATLGAVEHGILAPLGWVHLARSESHGGGHRLVGPMADGRVGGTRWLPLATALVAALEAAPDVSGG